MGPSKAIPPETTPEKMKLSRTLPTDKNGNVYYGPNTIGAARDDVSYITSDGRTTLAQAVEKVSAQLTAAGYTGVAAKLRAYYA